MNRGYAATMVLCNDCVFTPGVVLVDGEGILLSVSELSGESAFVTFHDGALIVSSDNKEGKVVIGDKINIRRMFPFDYINKKRLPDTVVTELL
jgi:hypothetical protein